MRVDFRRISLLLSLALVLLATILIGNNYVYAAGAPGDVCTGCWCSGPKRCCNFGVEPYCDFVCQCSPVCGANCVIDSDCTEGWSCNGQVREYRKDYCNLDNCNCVYRVTISQDCATTCYDSCTTSKCDVAVNPDICIPNADCGSYTCSGGSCTKTCSRTCGAVCGNNEQCGNDFCVGTCGTGVNSCVWRDDLCATGGPNPPCTCTAYQDWDADTSSGTCTGCGQSWSIGGEVAATACCGDDSGENKRTRVCSTGSGCTTDASDDACCNANDKCVYNSVCYSSGTSYCAPWNSNVVTSCSAGSWSLVEDCSTKASTDSDGGDVPAAAGTCVDYTACSGAACPYTSYPDACVLGTQLTEYYNSGASCSSKAYTCSNFEVAATDTDGGDVPTSNGQCTPKTGAGCSSGAFSTVPGTGGGTDTCQGTCGTGPNSCAYVEFYPIDGADACPGTESCGSKQYDADTNSNTCNTCLGSGKWNLGGIANCCGDDANEYVRTRVCDGYACTTSAADDACCDQTSDCVLNSVCYNNGDGLPGVAGATCASGVWKDTTAPKTTINPNSAYNASGNVSSFTLTCSDTGGSGCDKSYYKIINSNDTCGTTGFTDGTSGTVTCPFGQICDKRVCFYSVDKASNQEAINMSGIFHLETNACMGASGCGDACLYSPGVCNATNGGCYAQGGCFLNCSVPLAGPGQTRLWGNQICGRSNATKCGPSQACGNSITNHYCSIGGAATQVTGSWTSYTPPAGSYGVGGTFHILVNGVSTSPSAFSGLTECQVVKANGNVIFFDNWGSGNVDFSYTIAQADTDPQGIWNVSYCGIWSDFLANAGWEMKYNGTLYTFVVDKSPPVIIINNPQQGGMYSSDFLVDATVTDAYSSVDKVFYRWQNATNNGTWVGMAKSGNDYTANFPVALVSDGVYSIKVRANDSVGNAGEAVVTNILIDREPPNITMLSPSPGWYKSDFEVKARITDNQGVDFARYRWENASGNGAWNTMTKDFYNNYTASFAVASVAPGNYSIRVWANDTRGNIANKTVDRIGIDYASPSSQMTKPAKGSFVMSKVFNISWTGSDAHSGVKCYYVTYKYCDNTNQLCPNEERNVSFPGGACTSLSEYEFDTSKELWWVQDINNYTFFFRSIALDNAGNYEPKAAWETNVTIYIPKLVTFSITENVTKNSVRNGGKIATGRTVVIDVRAKADVLDNLNITIYYSNHTLGASPTQWIPVSCINKRACNASIQVNATKAQNRLEVDYYIRAQNSSMVEYLPPPAPASYFYYTVYFHPVCNFLVTEEFRAILGSNELIGIEVRNIQDSFDNVTLWLMPGFGRFVETDAQKATVSLNPSEDRIVYARLIPSADDFTLSLVGNESHADPALYDEDSIKVIIGFPPNFSELSDFAAAALILLAAAIFFVFVKRE